jgi:alpha-2-macroglobulin
MIFFLRRLALLHGLLLPVLSLAAVFPHSVLAQAQDDVSDNDSPAAFALPGVSSDASAYARSLAAKFPAGGTTAQRQQTEAQATDAARRNDWASAAAALEARIGMANRAGGPDAGQWLALAQAQLQRSPPEAKRALQAGWLAYQSRDTGTDQVPALLLMAQALHVLDEPAQEIAALSAAVQRAPDDAVLAQRLAQVRQGAGLLVSGLDTIVEADPPRACFSFASPPSHSPTFHPQDWVGLSPPIPDAAVTREGDRICVSGLPLAATTNVTMRAGMPGDGGLVLKRDAVQPVAMGERAPRLVFDQRMFLLPRNQVPALTLTSTNVAAVHMRILRLSERTILPFVRDNQLGQALERDSADALISDAQPVWDGRADIPNRARNQLVRTALPLPDVFAKPGLYALLVERYMPGAKPDDQDYSGPFAAQMILRTDLAPTVWRGSDGLTVQLRGYADVQPRAGVKLQLMAHNNDILAERLTDADGVARFPAALLHGTGPMAPQSLHAFLAEDFAAIDLTSAAFDLSDRGVAGRANPGPLDSFVYLDRGIYRPGETVQIMALTRDAAGHVADLPLRLRVTRPNGELFREAVPERGPDGAVHWPVALSAGAPVGTWTVEVLADPAAPPIATHSFRVDAFVPDRMAVDIASASGPLAAGHAYALPVAARWLYGAPAASLSASATMKLAIDPAGPAALGGFAIGLDGEEYAPDTTSISVPDTDAQGRTAVPLLLTLAPDTTHPVAATVDVSVDDPSGRAVTTETVLPVRPAGNLIGIKPLFADGVQPGADASFDVAAISPDGARIALTATLRLVRELPDWRLVMNGRLGSFQIVWRDEPMETREVTIPAGDPLRFAKALPFGRYRIEVAEKGTLAASSVRFRVGFVGGDSPDVPDKVDVSAEQPAYAPGQTARVHIIAPFDGPATLAVLTDRVLALRDITVSASGSDVEVPVGADWGAGAYVAIHAFHPGGPTARPGRAIGLAWLSIEPATRRLEMSIGAPEKTMPREPVVIPVNAAPGAWVTLAAVDEGVLQLTRFAAPDPLTHFMGKRMLGIDIRDDWGRLIAPADGVATVLKQGGDEDTAGPRKIPQQVVALFTAPVQAGPDGVARITLTMPDYNGQLRLMAVGWQGDLIGSASQDMLVRDKLIAEPLLPRFLAPGDEARMVVQLQNVELPAGPVTTDITVDGPLRLAGPAHLAVTLAAPGETGAQAIPATQLAAIGAGTGHIRLEISAPDGFHVERDTTIEVAPARGSTSVVTGGEMAPGASAALTVASAQFVPGTWRATARFGGPVRYDPGAVIQALDAFPLWCLEQSASRGLPLSLLPDGAVAGTDRLGRLQKAVIAVLDKQRYDGAFGLWSAEDDAEPWLSAYATEFLLRAKVAGVAVPEGGLDHAIQFLASGLGGDIDSPARMAEQAYRLYALALAGQPRMAEARVLATRLAELPTPLARAQLGATLALGNDRTGGAAAFQAALADPARKDWGADYGSALRDQLAIAVLLKESGLLPDRLSRLVGQLPGVDLAPPNMNTQEQAWAGAAAGVLGRDGEPAEITLDGKAIAPAAVVSVPLIGPATAANTGKKPVWQSVSVTGVLAQAPPAARDGMRITRRFFTLDGASLDLDHLTQNSVFVLLLEGAALDGQDHRALLLQGLPAGWEITNRLGVGKVAGMDWLGELSATESEPALDDRYAAVIPVSARTPGFRVAVQLRAVTPGNFEIPGAELTDMYRPAVFARQAANRITVKAAE